MPVFFACVFCLCFLPVFFVDSAYAQESKELFTEFKIEENDLSPKQKQSMEKADNKPGVNEKKFVKLTSLNQILKGNKYEFTLAGQAKTVKAVLKKAVYDTDKDYTFFCKLEPEGDLIYRSKDGQLGIYIDYGGYTYESYPIEKDIHLLIKHSKKQDEGNVSCGTVPAVVKTEPKKNGNGRLAIVSPCEDSDKLRVLVVYTQSAQNSNPNIPWLADLCIQQFNAACNNSNIGNVQAELVGPFFLPNYQQNSDIEIEVENVANNSEIQTLRQQYKGDLVVLLSNANYMPYVTKTRNYDADPYNAYAVVKASIATNNYSFVHILSHLLSTRHAQCNVEPGALCDDNHPYSHSWRFNTGGFWSGTSTNTTVEHPVNYGSILLNFSNPNVYHMGQATGRSNNDNARRMSETFPFVKSYSIGPGFLRAYIDWSGSSYNPNSIFQPANTTYNLSAYAICGLPTYQYEWQISSSGFIFTTVGVGNNFSIYLGEYDFKVVRLKAYSADGQVAYTTITLMSTCAGCRIGIAETADQIAPNDLTANSDDFTLLRVFPNPVQEQLQVAFKVPKEEMVKVEIIDVQGKTLRVLTNQKYQSGVHQISYDCKDLVAGSYFCKLELAGAFAKVEKLILSK